MYKIIIIIVVRTYLYVFYIYIQEVFQRPPQHAHANKIAKDFVTLDASKLYWSYGGVRSYKSVRHKSGLRYGQAESNHFTVLYATSQ